MDALFYFVLFLALSGRSSATYCLCKDGAGDQALQKSIDYACGAGADCTPILQNGACYNPNTVKAHCDWAVNSYFQRKGQGAGTCDFSGTATQSANPPTTVAAGCTYPSSASTSSPGPTTGGTTTPTTGSTTPTTGGTTTTPTTTTPSSVFGTGLGPSGTGLENNGVAPFSIKDINFFLAYKVALCFSGLSLLLWA
uniref:Glucan endo-1 3-beta-glucosidase-like protein At1g69295 n=1 Tax=Rhizophora mucronata TaxID=61149 RepID=A0A2P2KM05_RHIMU